MQTIDAFEFYRSWLEGRLDSKTLFGVFGDMVGDLVPVTVHSEDLASCASGFVMRLGTTVYASGTMPSMFWLRNGKLHPRFQQVTTFGVIGFAGLPGMLRQLNTAPSEASVLELAALLFSRDMVQLVTYVTCPYRMFIPQHQLRRSCVRSAVLRYKDFCVALRIPGKERRDAKSVRRIFQAMLKLQA